MLRVITWTLFVIAVAAYALWFMPVARDPSILLAVLAGRWHELEIRDTIGTIPGVTTLVQAQIVYVTLLVFRWIYLPRRAPSRLEKSALVVVFLLACLRNLIWSERIAVIELLVPAAILFLRKPRYPRLTALVPVLRLWAWSSSFPFSSISAHGPHTTSIRYDSFAVFILARLSGYYVTALDNGAGLYETGAASPRRSTLPIGSGDSRWRSARHGLPESLGLDKYRARGVAVLECIARIQQFIRHLHAVR